MKNTKIQKHRLAGGFDPSAYTYVDQFDHRQNEVMDSQSGSYGEAHDSIDSAFNDELESNGYDCEHCTHCGSRLSSGALYRHTSGELIVIGLTCVNRLSFSKASDIQQAHRENRIQQGLLRGIMNASWRWRIVGEFLQQNSDKSAILADMLNKLAKYFSLSRRQISFARKLVREAGEKTAQAAEREAKIADAADWEDGRFEIEGEILSVKFKSNDFGGSYKMLVELADGRRCWGSLPSKLDEAGKGDIVRIKATFSKSNDDAKFAFFKRPSVVS
jgi:hypothetical protein